MKILNCIKNLFKVAKLLSVDDSGDLRFYTVSMLGKQQKVLGFTPYGLMTKPPDSSMVLLWSQQGQESNGIGIADDPKNRILKDLKKGEVALGNYTTTDYLYFDENGNLNVKVSNNLNINVGNNVNIISGGDYDQTVAGNSTESSVNHETTSTTLTHNGTNVGDDHAFLAL